MNSLDATAMLSHDMASIASSFQPVGGIEPSDRRLGLCAKNFLHAMQCYQHLTLHQAFFSTNVQSGMLASSLSYRASAPPHGLTELHE